MDNGFNDIVAQLYEKEFKTQEKAKYEHIRQSKEKAIEEQRVEAERTKEVSVEDENERVVPNEATNGIIGPNWSSVSPEEASQYMAIKTGVSASNGLMLFIRNRVETLMLKTLLGAGDYYRLIKAFMVRYHNLALKNT